MSLQKQCIHCGTISEEALFCGNCGRLLNTKLISQQPVSQTTPVSALRQKARFQTKTSPALRPRATEQTKPKSAPPRTPSPLYQKTTYKRKSIASSRGVSALPEAREEEIYQQKEALETIKQQLKVKPVNRRKRFLNFIIDLFFCSILSKLLNKALGFINIMSIFNIKDPTVGMVSKMMLGFTLGLIMPFVYYMVLETYCGKTIGKFFTKTHVVTETGEKPGIGAVLIRSLCRNIPLYLNELSFLFGGDLPVGWHDKFSKTRVVADK